MGEEMSNITGLTRAVADFVATLDGSDLPEEAVRLARRCILDGLAVSVAGTEQLGFEILLNHVKETGGHPQARFIGSSGSKVAVHQAALLNGLAGHAMDWDDTQLAEGPGRVYGLLTHPTVPPLAAGLALADMLGNVDGRTFLTAFMAGFEVECKIAETIHPDHYLKGFHSSGTIGTFGAAACAAKLLGLDADQTARAIGIAASMASGIRANFGTMTKPLHVGRAAQNGVTAVLLARQGFTADGEALDGPWGYLAVAGRGGEPQRLLNRLGKPFSIISPGVSIKPYPCGVLTHPSMDAMLKILRDHDLTADRIERIRLFAGANILGPIRYKSAHNALEGKFCLPFLLSAIAVAGKAGKKEFTDAFVQRPEVQEMQTRIDTILDPDIDRLGYDRIRSKVEVETKTGEIFVQEADENYRGGPDNPLTDAELEQKFLDCAAGVLDGEQCRDVFDSVWNLEKLADVGKLLATINSSKDGK
jgi:2-methylcitrate dehydratase PrpD